MKLLRVTIAAKRLGLSQKSIYRLVKAKKIKMVKVGPKKGYRIVESSLIKFLDDSLE
jgi:excisionase family DNA binding protein